MGFHILVGGQHVKQRYKDCNSIGINLIFYGEDGEIEYGGSEDIKIPIKDFEYQREFILKGI